MDRVSNHWQWQAATITDAADSSRNSTFASTTMSGLSDFCQMFLRAMALAPDGEASEYADDQFYANNAAEERCARRGGSWGNGAAAGVFYLNFAYPRSYTSASLGGRPAFYEKQ